MSDDVPTPSEEKASNASLGELISEVTRDFSTLMRQELELARAELTETAKRGGRGAGMMGGAAYGALMTLFFLSLALWWALGYVMGRGWSAVVVAVLWAIIALILYMVGRRQLQSVRGMPRTVDSVKKIPDALKRNEENQ